MIRAWLRRRRRSLLREAAILLCALVLGMGYSFLRTDAYLPSINGNVYAMLASGDTILMVLSNGNNNSIVRIDRGGTLLNYMDTAAGQAFKDLESDGETVYAILSKSQRGLTHQYLAALSLKTPAMKASVLTDLSTLPNAPAPDIVWQEVYLPPQGGASPALRLAGVDGQGQGYLLYWDLAAGQAAFEKILEGEDILFLKYVSDGHYVWISRDKQAGQSIGGVRQRNLLDGLAATPLHISTCGSRCFVSDSVSGDIFELAQDGTAARYRGGSDQVGSSGCRYRQFETYTTYLDADGEVRMIGLCASGTGSVIAGEEQAIRALRPGALRLRMLWQHGWRAALALWIVLSVLAEAVWGILNAPQLAVRLLLCEIIAASVLLASVTAVQYRSFQDTMREEAYQKLRLIGGSLALTLSAEAEWSGETADNAVMLLERQINAAMGGEDRSYSISVIRAAATGAEILSDGSIPEGYQVEDVKSREYFSTVSGILRRGGSTLARIQTDTGSDYLYVQRFKQEGRMGCVAVSQAEDVMLDGGPEFLKKTIPIWAACPLLFGALLWITRRLLRPLDEIQRALVQFYEHKCRGGNQMDLDAMSRTEFYEVGRVFNQLSTRTRILFNALQSVNDAYVRLAPDCLLDMLHKQDVNELSAGDHAPVDGALLLLVPRHFSPDWASLDRLAGIAAALIGDNGGMLVDYDEGLCSLTALFPQAECARKCALACLAGFEADGLEVMAAVLEETVEVGVLGGGKLLYPLAVSQDMRRKQEVLERLRSFDAALVYSGGAVEPGLRLLGWDGERAYYESPALRPPDWQNRWHEAAPLWDGAMELFRGQKFPEAMRLFAKALLLMPDDLAARWYLFRCESLRDGAGQPPDTGILPDAFS